MKLTGIFGGTFDPIHCGHLAIAEYLSTHCSLNAIQFVPCLLPPHRQQPQASAAQRLAMVRLAIADHAGWSVNDIDFQRPGPSYMVDTLTQLHQHQQQPQTAWCLILGMDAFAHFNEWRQWQTILNLAHLIVVNRPDYALPQTDWSQALLLQRQVNSCQELAQANAGQILVQNLPPSPISATAIRQQSIPNLHSALPPAVLQYIQQHHLYRS